MKRKKNNVIPFLTENALPLGPLNLHSQVLS